MPLFDDNDTGIVQAPSGYQFSMTSLDVLGAAEYTLCGVVTDVSGSVMPYVKEMESCLKQILDSCKKSQRAENLMLRLISFNSNINELHGYRLLDSIDSSEYDNILKCYGSTAVYDATYAMLESVDVYGKTLTDQDFDVNGIVFVITDGEDNQSKFTPARIAELRERMIKSESLESVLVILIGVGSDVSTSYLSTFKNEAKLDEAINIGEADEKTLAKLAEFVSQSISSQSQALGSGGPSVILSI